MKKMRIGTKDYYKVEQLKAIVHGDSEKDICTGCAFFERNQFDISECPRDREGNPKCQTWLETDEGTVIIEHIFIPATREGLTAFAIHRLENS